MVKAASHACLQPLLTLNQQQMATAEAAGVPLQLPRPHARTSLTTLAQPTILIPSDSSRVR
jgi:hypothetical protein